MNEKKLKPGMIIRVQTLSVFMKDDPLYSEYIGQTAIILKGKYCTACGRKHYDILFDDGTKVIDEFSSNNFIQANQNLKGANQCV